MTTAQDVCHRHLADKAAGWQSSRYNYNKNKCGGYLTRPPEKFGTVLNYKHPS